MHLCTFSLPLHPPSGWVGEIESEQKHPLSPKRGPNAGVFVYNDDFQVAQKSSLEVHVLGNTHFESDHGGEQMHLFILSLSFLPHQEEKENNQMHLFSFKAWPQMARPCRQVVVPLQAYLRGLDSQVGGIL